MGADLLGFHTYDYARHFLSSIRTILGIEHTFGQIQTEDYFLKVDVFPMGINYKRFASAASNKNVQRIKRVFHKKLGDRKIILSIDRLDYSKGILQRLKAFDLFFITALWLIALWLASRLINGSLFKLISVSVLAIVILYLILLISYFSLFLYFLGETLGDRLFHQRG